MSEQISQENKILMIKNFENKILEQHKEFTDGLNALWTVFIIIFLLMVFTFLFFQTYALSNSEICEKKTDDHVTINIFFKGDELKIDDQRLKIDTKNAFITNSVDHNE